MDVLSASVFSREEAKVARLIREAGGQEGHGVGPGPTIHSSPRLSEVVFTGAAKLLATRISKGTCLATGQPRKFPRAKWVWLASLIGGRKALDAFFGGKSCELRVAEPEHTEPTITNYYHCVAVGGEA